MATRSTIEIDSEVLEAARREAERRQVPVEEFIEEALADAMGSRNSDARTKATRAALPVSSADGWLRAEVPQNSTAELLDYLDEPENRPMP